MMNKKKLWKWHSWLGLYSGLVICILSFTGALAVFKFEIDHLLNKDLFYVVPQEKIGNVNQFIYDILAHYPEHSGYIVEPAEAENRSWKVAFRVKEEGQNIAKEVFFNPYTGEVLGERDMYKTVAFFIRNIHVRLFDGWYGRQWVGLAGVCMFLSLAISIPLYFDFTKKQKFGEVRTKRSRQKWADLHKFIGLATIVFHLIIAFTGAWLGLQPKIQKPLIGERPGIYKPAEFPLSKNEDKLVEIDFPTLLSKVKKEFPELTSLKIKASADGSRTATVYGNIPWMPYERQTNFVVLDKEDLLLIKKLDIRKTGIGSHLFYMQEALHFGDFWGIGLKVIYCLFGLIGGFLGISGFFVYYKRTEKKRVQRYPLLTTANIIYGFTFICLLVTALIAFSSVNFGANYPTSTITTPSFYVILSAYIIYRLMRYFFKKGFLHVEA
ncbi:PepSY-associated TM helix domain-containing protein [Flammeovirga aprica]|uniref:PepSY domain-containing protein n=1 Tax=Flammeovirga aprica JL-4 TaxID=694437 RepID=A0A7X9RSX1_9BACT|nr:PepSY-associated TM helix domain-containing protein [Flammeovirga aprica]NME66544.1 PepSY domain-containing protein [Flammeovirga aprica JL-4]